MSSFANGNHSADHTVSRPSMPSHPSTSTNQPTKHAPGKIIEISDSDSEDDHIEILSAPKVKSATQAKRPSSSIQQRTLDVSDWNRGNSFKPPAQNKVKDSAPRPILSSSTNRPQVASRSPQRNSLGARKDLLDKLPDQIPLFNKSTSPEIYPSSVTEYSESAHAGHNSRSKGALNPSKVIPHNSHISRTKEDAPRLLTQRNELNVNQAKPPAQARPPVPPNKSRNLLHKLNSFSYDSTDLTRSKTTVDKSPQKDGWGASLSTSSTNANRSKGELSSMMVDRSARHVLDIPKYRTGKDHSTEAGSASKQNGSSMSQAPATTRVDNEQVRPVLPPSAPPKGKDKSPGTCTLAQKARASPEKLIHAPLRGDSTGDASDAVTHIRKKRKHVLPFQPDRDEDRFVELPDSDPEAQPVCFTSYQSRHESLANPTSFEAGSQTKQTGSSGPPANNPTRPPAASCVIHPSGLLPLPPVIPRARPKSPDWSQIPRHLRPLQGRERPEEFSDELQKTWILKNTPDLSTPLGHLVFTEEINSNQMWENPAIPRIEVVVPDDVKERMFEDSKKTDTPQDAKFTLLDPFLAPPMEFIYTDRLIYRNNERPIPPSWHCNCHGDCLYNPNCQCRAYQSQKIRQIAAACDFELSEAVKNFEGFAYLSNRKARNSHHKKPENSDPDARSINDIFTKGGFPVFECNDFCGCGPDCINRTVGRGRREKLSIEKTVTRGWGVFAEHTIPLGRLVTHYSGEVITDAMSLDRGQKKYDNIGRTYIFDLDPWWIKTVHSQSLNKDGLLVICEAAKSADNAKTLTAAHPNVNGSLTTSSSTAQKKKKKKQSKRQDENEVECIYSVDAFLYGNISRFINHSCSANTAIVPVYIDDSDPTRPIFAMFANKAIKAGTEITTSYSDPNADADEMMDQQIRQTHESHLGRYMRCKCGASNCRGMMFA